MADADDYVARASASIMRILDEHHAVVTFELESRLAEHEFLQSKDNIDVHHITTALRELERAGRITFDQSTLTRGGKEIQTIQPADQYKRRTKIAEAAQRKRLLYARYLGWAQGSARHPHGVIGHAGEASARQAIIRAGTLLPAQPDAGEVKEILGLRLPGALDSGGFMVPVANHLPGRPVTILVEVKNIRAWIFPTAQEVYQLLHKAVLVQQYQPDLLVLPVLICRAAHKTLFIMAKQLGFFVIDTHRQYAGNVNVHHVEEIRLELQFSDLRAGAEPSIRVQDRFRKVLPLHCTTMAARWKTTASNPDLAATIAALRKDKSAATRRNHTNLLRAFSINAGHDGGW